MNGDGLEADAAAAPSPELEPVGEPAASASADDTAESQDGYVPMSEWIGDFDRRP